MRRKLVICVIIIGIVSSYAVMLKKAGFFEPTYWEKHRVVYDPLLKRDRCIDKISGELMEIDPPCAVLKMNGQEAITMRKDKCIHDGGSADACYKESLKWMMSKLEKPKSPPQKTVRRLYDRDQ